MDRSLHTRARAVALVPLLFERTTDDDQAEEQQPQKDYYYTACWVYAMMIVYDI